MGMPDLHREAPSSSLADVAGNLIDVETKLDALLKEQRKSRKLLERLVALEEERRAGERPMEALAAALTPGGAAMAEPAEELNWFRRPDMTYGINELDGTQRPATPEETARIQAQLGAAKARNRS